MGSGFSSPRRGGFDGFRGRLGQPEPPARQAAPSPARLRRMAATALITCRNRAVPT